MQSERVKLKLVTIFTWNFERRTHIAYGWLWAGVADVAAVIQFKMFIKVSWIL